MKKVAPIVKRAVNEYVASQLKKLSEHRETLKTYYIDYEVCFDDDVDVEHCWYNAYSADDALRQFRAEYGNKYNVIQIRER